MRLREAQSLAPAVAADVVLDLDATSARDDLVARADADLVVVCTVRVADAGDRAARAEGRNSPMTATTCSISA